MILSGKASMGVSKADDEHHCSDAEARSSPNAFDEPKSETTLISKHERACKDYDADNSIFNDLSQLHDIPPKFYRYAALFIMLFESTLRRLTFFFSLIRDRS